MKKISMKALLSCLLGETIVLLSLLFLTKDSSYYWIAVGVMATILIFTFYKLIGNIYNYIKSWEEQQNENNVALFQELINAQVVQQSELFEKIQSINDSYISSNESIKQNIEDVTKLQSKVLESNKETLMEISDLMRQMDENNKNVCQELTNIFEKNTAEMSRKHADDLENVVITLRSGVETLSTKYTKALEELSNGQQLQLDAWKDGMIGILDKSQVEITALLSCTESEVLENSKMSRSAIESNINNTQKAISDIVNEAKSQLSEQYNNINALYAKLSQSTEECSRQVMEQMLNTSEENITQMEQSMERILEKVAERLVAENEKAGKNRIEVFQENMQELEGTYDKLIGSHIKSLEEQVLCCIERFIAENQEALNSNNKLANNLISSEQSFLSEIEKHNGELKETISNAINEYSTAVGLNILEMRDVLTASISDSTQSTNDEIIKIATRNSETIEQFAEKLRVYSDSLVEKSALAIAEVQSDNNTKLQEVCEQVTKYISENAGFINYCEKLNNSLKDKITQLVDDRNSFVEEMKNIADNQLIGMDEQMKERIKDLFEKIHNLNIENADTYNKSMIDYREKFVEANAKAIAEVQADNINSITDANEKVAQLAENLKKFQRDIVGTLGLLQSIIDEGIKNQQTQDEEFGSTMSDLVDEKLTEYDRKLQEYNETFTSLGEKITEVMNACYSNTANYEKTLSFIIDAQKEANSLNSKDIDLLKSLMKR